MAANPLRAVWRKIVRQQSAGHLNPKELEAALQVVDEFQGYAEALERVGLGNDEPPFSPLLHALPRRRPQ